MERRRLNGSTEEDAWQVSENYILFDDALNVVLPKTKTEILGEVKMICYPFIQMVYFGLYSLPYSLQCYAKKKKKKR